LPPNPRPSDLRGDEENGELACEGGASPTTAEPLAAPSGRGTGRCPGEDGGGWGRPPRGQGAKGAVALSIAAAHGTTSQCYAQLRRERSPFDARRAACSTAGREASAVGTSYRRAVAEGVGSQPAAVRAPRPREQGQARPRIEGRTHPVVRRSGTAQPGGRSRVGSRARRQFRDELREAGAEGIVTRSGVRGWAGGGSISKVERLRKRVHHRSKLLVGSCRSRRPT